MGTPRIVYLYMLGTLVPILDGSSEHAAHNIWNKSGISIRSRHLATSKESLNPIFFLTKGLFYFICAQYVLSYHLVHVPWLGPETANSRGRMLSDLLS